MTMTFSPNEASFLTGQSTAAVNRAIDRNEIGSAATAAKATRKVDRAQLRALAVIGALDKDLTPAGRKKVAAAVQRLPTDEHRVDVGRMEFRLDDLDLQIDTRLARLEALRQFVQP